MSLGLPSNGLSVLSPTRPSEVYIQEINTLKGMTSQTMCPLITPPTLSLRLSNSLSNPKGSKRQNSLMKKELMEILDTLTSALLEEEISD